MRALKPLSGKPFWSIQWGQIAPKRKTALQLEHKLIMNYFSIIPNSQVGKFCC